MLEGSCHCGALALRFESTKVPAELPVRVCGCTFCTKHRPRYTSDPAGRVTIDLAGDVSRYRFGLALADFLICRTCGVFVAAYEEPGRAVINLECLVRAAELSGDALRMDVSSEDAAARTARRAKSWTPATIVVSRS